MFICIYIYIYGGLRPLPLALFELNDLMMQCSLAFLLCLLCLRCSLCLLRRCACFARFACFACCARCARGACFASCACCACFACCACLLRVGMLGVALDFILDAFDSFGALWMSCGGSAQNTVQNVVKTLLGTPFRTPFRTALRILSNINPIEFNINSIQPNRFQ